MLTPVKKIMIQLINYLNGEELFEHFMKKELQKTNQN